MSAVSLKIVLQQLSIRRWYANFISESFAMTFYGLARSMPQLLRACVYVLYAPNPRAQPSTAWTVDEVTL
jgi:hypothetical protein